MCGLIVTRTGEENFLKGLEALAHRGLRSSVGSQGVWKLGHVRLPIVGTDARFDQPYRHKGWTFLFVGEVVNFRELVTTAECDVDVLAKYWANLGPRCLRLFDGFWSVVAISPDGLVQIATDFLAKKPLYYRTDRFAVASEIKALTALAPVDPDPVYFSSVRKFGYHAGDRTWAKQVRKLPPGCLWTIDPIAGTVGWDPLNDVVEPDPFIDPFEALRVSVKRRILSSDVPIAMLHSGGLDSSLIYAMARGLSQEMVVYNLPEEGGADLSLCGIDGPVISVEPPGPPVGIPGDLDTILKANEGPVDLGSMIPQYRMGQAVKERVAISGDGADELFGGYKRSLQYDSQGSDVFEELVYYHLPRLDKLMMAGTVELRSPFLGRDVLRGALALPWDQRRNKNYLRNAAGKRGLLPWAVCQGEKVPLKSAQVLHDPAKWRMELCDRFEQMIRNGLV
jgi:asparagine synthase (glutamine-hydrolysing)